MIVSEKPDQSTSDQRGSDASVSRRGFLKRLTAGGVVLAAPAFVPSSALGLGKAVAASERIGVGMIGFGLQGNYLANNLRGDPNFQLVAVCDVIEKRVEGQRSQGLATYTDFRDLLARDDINAVFIATPSHWHAIHAIEAAKAGKDIYCEKPMTLCIREGREMVKAVRRHGRVFQHDTMQRSGQEFLFACEMVRNGRIGTLESVYLYIGGPPRDCYLPAEPVPKGVHWDMWLGPAPWRPFNSSFISGVWGWANFRDYGGGSMTDWGPHHYDIIHWAMGMDDSGPVDIIPPNSDNENRLTWRYANGVNVYHINQDIKRAVPTYTVVFEGTDGKLEVNRGLGPRLQTWPASIMEEPTRSDEIHLDRSAGVNPLPPAHPIGPMSKVHIADFLRAVRTREKPICDVEVGHRTTTACHLANIAFLLNRPLKWDPVTERFTNDAQANRRLDRPRREPWTL